MQATFEKRYHLFSHGIILLTVAGIGVSFYLSLSHFWIYTDPTYSSFCAISRAINCDTVAQSPWSVLLGTPVAQWGLFGYIIFVILLRPLRSLSSAPLFLWSLLVLLSGLYSLVSIYFSYISATRIHSYCILCLICFTINLSLFFFCWFVRQRVKSKTFMVDISLSIRYVFCNKTLMLSLILLLIVLILIHTFSPRYWLLEIPPALGEIPTGVTAQGHPWIGAEDPLLTIEEFSDYQCFQCAKSHFLLRQLVTHYPKTLRLIHRNYPMDHEVNPTVVTEPFHVGSGKMALLAIFAQTRGKFWEMNDILFELGRSKKSFDTIYLEEKTGIPSAKLAAAILHPVFRQQLNLDILAGMKLRILATPTFVVNGQKYTGLIPPEILDIITDNK